MLTVLDLFCGGGGSSYGARMAGLKVVAGVDINPLARATFEDNFGARTYGDRVEDLDPRRVLEECGPIDVIVASPECTNHSVAKGAAPRCEASKDTAIATLRFIEEIRPKRVVIENVAAMRDWHRYGELLERLASAGYDVREHLLDASDFRVPQARKRLFLACDREGPAPAEITRPAGPKITVREILDPPGTHPVQPLRKPGRAEGTLERARKAIEALGPGEDFLIVYYGSDGSGGWSRLDRPLRTITTVDRFGLVQSNGGEHTIRMLQPAELRRAMGLGDDYRMTKGTRRDRVRILGNGVCPPVMARILESFA